MTNPFTSMKYWVRWEILDLNAILELINTKASLESKRIKNISKNDTNKRTL